MEQIREETDHRLKLRLLSAALMIFVAQLDINLIINGFRISLAIIFLPVFAFLSKGFPVFSVTAIAAPGILLVRCIVEWLHGGDFLQAFWSYSPEMMFYLSYGALFAFYAWLVPMQRFSVVRLIPLIGIDMISNLFEICIRLGHDALSPTVLLRLLIVALGRTAVAAICLAALDAYGVFILHRDDRLRYRKLLLLTSQLKSEVIWMNKNTTRIEETMSVSYGLYNQLSALEGEQAQQLAQKALTVAKDIHEIKKEYYLIMSGISSALETDQEENGMWLKNILQIVQDSMRRAFEKDGKKVRIDIALQKNFYTDKHYYLMSVLRNLVNNAAEAAGEERADVLVEQKEKNGDCVLQVHDNCGGIAPEYLPTIFEPGFSTKINFETGKVSRGLGLSLVKDIVEEELGGVISVKSQNGCTDFTIRIPRENLEVER